MTPDERHLRAYEMRAAGATYKEIGVAIGVSRQTAGDYFRSDRKPIDYAAIAKRAERARELQGLGATYKQIGAELDISLSQVRRDLRPERLERDRVHSREFKRKQTKGACNECGGPTTWVSRSKGYGSRCTWCVRGIPLKDRPASALVRPGIHDAKIPADVKRKKPPRTKLPLVVSAHQLTESFDCQAYGCVRDALAGEQFCRRHLDVSTKTG